MSPYQPIPPPPPRYPTATAPRKKRRIGRAIGIGLLGLTALYTTTCGAAKVFARNDYETRHKRWLSENVRNEMVEQEFLATIDGQKKRLTLLGEVHLYNEQEASYAKRRIQEFDLVLYEGADSKSNIGFFDIPFLVAFAATYHSGLYYYALGSGRTIEKHPFIDGAKNHGIPFLYTENDTAGGIHTFTLGDKIEIIYEGIKMTATAPLNYWEGKNEVETQKDILTQMRDDLDAAVSGTNDALKVNKRNELMADQIVAYLRERPETKVLIGTGRAHFTGLKEELGKRMTLEALTEPHTPTDACLATLPRNNGRSGRVTPAGLAANDWGHVPPAPYTIPDVASSEDSTIYTEPPIEPITESPVETLENDPTPLNSEWRSSEEYGNTRRDTGEGEKRAHPRR
ncbi:TPA: hypothetical protein HA251_02735 [Candidatus Woesearchaeota archaeon]|nr:hypothetical protein [Candidatus Woesearchaeota archaeon]